MRHATDYARLTPLPARAVLGAILLAAGLGVAVTLSPLGSTNILTWVKGGNDVALYRAEVDRIHRGEGYYQAAAAELTPRGYPTRSVFNWRTPLPVWLLGKLPAVAIGKVLLGGLSLLLMLMAIGRWPAMRIGTAKPLPVVKRRQPGWQFNCHPNRPRRRPLVAAL